MDKGLNNVSNRGVVSRFRYNATAVYEAQTWNMSVTQNFQKRYRDSASSITLVTREVSAYDTIDSQASYVGLKSISPWASAISSTRCRRMRTMHRSTNNFVGGYDITYADPLGRFVYARVKYTLH